MSTMLINPLLDVMTIVFDFLGIALIKPGPVEKETGGSALKFRRS